MGLLSRLLPKETLMPQVQRSPEVHDVVVIGSGAGGGAAVKVLTDLGMKVTLLEAGPMLNPNKDFKEHVWPCEVAHRWTRMPKTTLTRISTPSATSSCPTFIGTSLVNPSPSPKAANSAGSAPASWVGAPTITAESRSVSPTTTLSPAHSTASVPIGP